MKKTLLFILAAVFCVSLAAQPKSSPDLIKLAGKPQPATKIVYGAHDDNFNYVPSERPSDYVNATSQTRGTTVIGQTHYILASNSNMRNTIDWSPDGATCATTWMVGSKPSGPVGVRGTTINYYDDASNSWGAQPTLDPNDPNFRIETGPNAWAPGWGTHVYTEQGECVVAHCTAAADKQGAMLINYREKRGEGEWIQNVIQGPKLTCEGENSTAVLWPTIAAVGNTVHMFCVTNQDLDSVCMYGPSGHDMHPLYYRSKDGGKTWENPFDFIVGGTCLFPEDDLDRLSADDYVMTVRGNHIVVAYHTGFNIRVGYIESNDGGDTWVRKVAYDAPLNWESSGVGEQPVLLPTNLAATIGDDGVVHISFAFHLIYRPKTAEPHYYSAFWILWGIYAWNSNHPTVTREDLDTEWDFVNDTWANLGLFDIPNVLYAPGILGKPDFEFTESFDPEVMFIENYDNHGKVEHPRLIAKDGKVYLMYSSIIEEPLLHPSNNQFIRGVFLTVSNDNGETYVQFGNTSWLSYGPDLFFYDWTGFDPENPYETAPDPIVLSENGYPTMASSIQNNKIVLTWYNDILQFPAWPSSAQPWIATPYKIYSVIIDVPKILDYNNTTKVCTSSVKEQALENLKLYPNPASDIVLVKLETNEPFTVTVTNMMGQVVKTIQGQNKAEFNVSNYPSGIYIVNVRTAKATSSQKLIVK